MRRLAREAAAPAAQRPRTKPSDVRREELLASGERLFLERGVAGTSIDDIAAGADVAKGTFYLYFSSKEDFLGALRERYGAGYAARIAAHVASRAAPDWAGRLDAWVEGGINGYLDQVPLHDALFFGGDFHPRRRMSKGEGGIVGTLADLLREGNAARAWRVADPVFTAVLLFNALHFAVDHAIANREEAAREPLVAAVQDFFRRAVGLA